MESEYPVKCQLIPWSQEKTRQNGSANLFPIVGHNIIGIFLQGIALGFLMA